VTGRDGEDEARGGGFGAVRRVWRDAQSDLVEVLQRVCARRLAELRVVLPQAVGGAVLDGGSRGRENEPRVKPGDTWVVDEKRRRRCAPDGEEPIALEHELHAGVVRTEEAAPHLRDGLLLLLLLLGLRPSVVVGLRVGRLVRVALRGGRLLVHVAPCRCFDQRHPRQGSIRRVVGE
jgi:hypothetical protein